MSFLCNNNSVNTLVKKINWYWVVPLLAGSILLFEGYQFFQISNNSSPAKIYLDADKIGAPCSLNNMYGIWNVYGEIYPNGVSAKNTQTQSLMTYKFNEDGNYFFVQPDDKSTSQLNPVQTKGTYKLKGYLLNLSGEVQNERTYCTFATSNTSKLLRNSAIQQGDLIISKVNSQTLTSIVFFLHKQ